MPYKSIDDQKYYQRTWIRKKRRLNKRPRKVSQRGIKFNHGTVSGYDYHKCRCLACLSAKTYRKRMLETN